MTPLRAPIDVRGDIPGLLRRGMPVYPPDTDLPLNPGEHDSAVVCTMPDADWLSVEPHASAWIGYARFNTWRQARAVKPGLLTIDYTDPAAIYLSLHYLADRGHVSTWMLPTTHGGRIDAWDGLTAWEVSAIVVSASVGRVAAGRPGIACVARAYGIPTNARMSMDRIGQADVYWTATDADRDYFVAPTRLGHDTRATPDHPGWLYTPRLGFTSHGPEVGAEAVVRINECALADGCALLVPGGVATPNL